MCKLADQHGCTFSPLRACLIIFIYFFAIAPSVAETVSPATANLQASENFIVSTNDGLVSVKATEAPLKDVIERIGQVLGIEVVAQIGEEEKVTVEFQDLTLDQAMERLSGNYAYTTDSEGSEVVKFFIFPKGEDSPATGGVAEVYENAAGPSDSSAEPFKFEFDPADFIDKSN